MRGAAHFSVVDRHSAKFPYAFEQFYFYRWGHRLPRAPEDRTRR